MEGIVSVESILIGMGYKTSTAAQAILLDCEEWYRNSEQTKHQRTTVNGETYQLLHMGFGKRVCSDDASLCEVVEVNAGGDNTAQFEAINDLLADNQFDAMYRRQLEICAALGTAACYVRLEGADVLEDGNGTQSLSGGRVRLNYVDGTGFFPLAVENGVVQEAAFAGTELKDGKTITTIVICTRPSKYQYRTLVYDDNGKMVSDIVSELGDVKPFAVLRTADVNNIKDMQGYGMPKLYNAIPVLLALDSAWTALFGDIEMSDKITLINELLCGFDDQGIPIKPNTELKRRFVMLGGEKLPDAKTMAQEIIPEIRVDKFRDAIELLLSVLSMMFGYGMKKYRFESGQITTATQYVGERQDQLQDLNKQRAEAKLYIKDIIRAAIWFMNTYQGTTWNADVDIAIEFEDSYITDDASRLLEMRNDILAGIGGVNVVALYLKEKYNLDDTEAMKWATGSVEPPEDDTTA